MDSLVALSPILIMIAIVAAGLLAVKLVILKNFHHSSPENLEKRVAALELEVNKLKSKG